MKIKLEKYRNYGGLGQLRHFDSAFPFLQIYVEKNFVPGCPAVKTWGFHCHGPGSNPAWGTKIHKMPMLSHFSGIQLVETRWTIPHQAPLSMRFPRQEYWSWVTISYSQDAQLPHFPHPKRERVLWKKRKCGPLLVSKSLCKELRNSHSILTSKKLGRLLKTKKTQQLFLDL